MHGFQTSLKNSGNKINNERFRGAKLVFRFFRAVKIMLNHHPGADILGECGFGIGK
jgi:hypothetical protein